MDMNQAVAKAIAAERSIAGLTVRELSERSGIPMSSLMRVLGAQREIKVNQVELIASALEIYPHEIIETAEALIERESRPRLQEAELSQAGYALAYSEADIDSEVEAQQEEP